MLFSLNGIDYTKFVMEKQYNIKQEDVYGNTAWVDANYVKHRSVVRTEVSGSFVLQFDKEDEYDEFLGHVESSKTAGHNPITIYVNNTNKLKSIEAYLTIDSNVLKTTEAFGREFAFASVTVMVEER